MPVQSYYDEKEEKRADGCAVIGIVLIFIAGFAVIALLYTFL